MGSRRKWLVVAFVACVAAGAVAWPYLRGPKDDFGRFQGEWQLAVPAVDRDGKPAARATPVTVRVAGDRWVFVANGQERGRYTVTIRPESKEIDLVQLGKDDQPTGQRSHGVYAIDRDQAKVAHAPVEDPRPTDPDAEDATVWLLDRVK